jgi:hypothetical protein
MPVDCQVAVSKPPARGHADSRHLDAQGGGFPVDIVDDAASHGEVKHMPAGEIGLYRDAAIGLPVREADSGI